MALSANVIRINMDTSRWWREIAVLLFVVWTSAAGFAADPVTELRDKVRNGEVRLEFDAERGYLPSLLRALNVPVSSQTLVFSKTSFQSEYISPVAPRALYFNDDVYVCWVFGRRVTELILCNRGGSAAF